MKNFIKSFTIQLALTAGFFLSMANLAFGQLELPEDKVTAKFRVVQTGCEASIEAVVTCVDHWHINAVHLPESSFGYASSLNLEDSPAYEKRGKVTEPKPIFLYDEKAKEDLYYHEGTITFKQK